MINKLLNYFFVKGALFSCLISIIFVTVGIQDVRASAKTDEDAVQVEAPYYLEMKPISVPIRKKSGAIRYYMFLTVSLEFDEDDKKDKARKMIPRLRDAFLQDMSGHSVLHKDRSRGIDFELIKNRLLKQAQRVLRKDAPIGVNIVRLQKGG